MTAERFSRLPPRQTAAVAFAMAALMALASLTQAWYHLELKGYDQLAMAHAPGKSQLPITIIAIDEASFSEIGQRWPWPRALHARLIDDLTRAGALLIVFDVLFSEASTPEDDRALAAAIERNGNVVLGSHVAYQETAHSRQWIRVDPLEALQRAGAANGLADVPLDPDLIVRRMPEGADVLWREIVRKANALRPGMLPEPVLEPGAMVRFAGGDHTFPYISYYQALDMAKYLPPDAFQDQIVFVGRDVKASPEAGYMQADTFATPFSESSGWLMPGVEIHANVLESALRGDVLRPAPPWAPFALLVTSAVASAVAMRRWRPLPSLAWALVLVGLVVALAWALFTQKSLWIPALSSVSVIVAIYLALGGLAFLSEQRRRNEMRRAFALYVSPEVVESMLEHPERLVLGGERREITVLFTDLKGFTTLSEALGPERVTEVVSEHFTRASAIIKRNGGTVTQFIGDAVMAIWNAPLDEPRHATRAIAAARELQADIAQMRQALVARGLPEIFMRIGVHTCPAIVGNLGAADRFNYTAIGDGVNLSSRLEGVNKLFGTGILLSADTAGRLEDASELRVVGRVIVKGKVEPTDVFTPDPDAAVRAATAKALAAYRERDWDGSEAAWREVLALRPGDGVAAHYLAKIAEWRAHPPPPVWDWGEALEKL